MTLYSTTEDISSRIDVIYDANKQNVKAYQLLIGICLGMRFNCVIASDAEKIIDELIKQFTLVALSPITGEIKNFTELISLLKIQSTNSGSGV